MMSTVRWLLIALTVLLAGFNVVASSIITAVWPFGDPGYSQHWPDLVIRAVRPGYPAERAGVRPGDTIALARLPFHDRLTVIGYRGPLRGEITQLDVTRAGVDRTFVIRNGASAYNVRIVVASVVSVLTDFMIAALVIFVLLRSATVEAFALCGLATLFFQPNGWSIDYFGGDVADAVYSGFLSDLLGGVVVTSMIVLALRAMGRLTHRRWFERGAIAFGLAMYALLQYSDILILVYGKIPPKLVTVGAQNELLLPALAMIVIVATAFFRARGPARVRLRWATIGFALIAGDFLIYYTLSQFPAFDFVVWPSFVYLFVINAGFGTLGFAIVRRDLFDVSFVINRAAIYATLTALLVGAFAALNWSIGVVLKQTGVALPIDVILAGAVGLSLNVIQRRVDRNVDKVFFRQRYEADQRLRRIARALGHVTDNDAIAHALVVEPLEALGMHAAAFYRLASSGAYELVASRGWPPGSPAAVSANDPLVLHLSGVTEALRLESVPHDAAFPHGLPRPRIAFPLWSRRELMGFMLYSSHYNGAMLDPDEVELIERLAAAATVALERVAAMSLQERFASLEAEFESVKAQRDEFLGMLAGARSVTRAIASETT